MPMRYSLTFLAGSALVLGFCLGLAGCARAPSEAPAAAPIPVTVSYPVEREVTDYADFTGRTAAVDSVEVRARVWGYLDKVNFKEGALVKKGDVLFEIDPRPYQAVLDQAKAKVAQDEAQLTFDEARVPAESEARWSPGAVSQDGPGQDRRRPRDVDCANIAAAKAAVARRQLDLEYTKVTAPISGRVSRYVVTVGNLVQSGDQGGGTLLTTIVSVDPMYAYFDVDEHTVLRVRQLIREGKAESARDGELPGVAGPGQRGRVSPPGHDQFRGQPGQSEDRHAAAARRVPQQGRGALPRAISPASGCPSAGPTRRCWSPTAPSTPTRARRSSTSSTRRTRWSPAPSGWERCTTACG